MIETYKEQIGKIIKRTYDYLRRKYGKDGYSRMVLYYEPDMKKIEQIQKVLDSSEMFIEVFNECYRRCLEER